MKIKKIDLKIRAKLNPIQERIFSHVKSPFFRDITTQLLAIPGIVLVIVAWILSFYYFRASSYEIPTRYSSFLGVTSLGYWYDLYQIPFFLTLSVVLNVFLANSLYKKDKFISYILVSTNVFISIVTLAVIISFGILVNA